MIKNFNFNVIERKIDPHFREQTLKHGKFAHIKPNIDALIIYEEGHLSYL